MLKRIRPLSIAIFVAVLMLTVRLGGLWRDLAVEVGVAGEAQSPATGAPTKLTGDAKPAPAATPAQAGAPQAAAPAGNAGAKPPANKDSGGKDSASKTSAADATGATEPSASLPIDFTASEVSLLQNLSQRREEIDRRAQEVELREGLLKATEKRLDDKIAKLEELQGTLKNLLKQYDAKTDSQLQSLVKIYETMKPRDAARIWDELDMPVLLQVVERMREQKAALILAAMNPDVAKRVTDELIRRRLLPGSTFDAGNG